MEIRLFIGNLSWKTRKQDVWDLFSELGLELLDAVVMFDRETGKSRGFGFATVGSNEDAQKAIEALNGKDFMGRPLKINVALPKEQNMSA